MSNTMDLLKELSEAAGVSGREENIRAIVTRELKGRVKSIEVDALGNLIAFVPGLATAAKRKKVMLAAHMDEIGFYVRFVDDQGFLRIHNVGGFDTRNLFARRVLVHTASGSFQGVMNPTGKPIHLASAEDRKQPKEIHDFYIDLGLPAKKVKSKVNVGDMVTLDAPFVEFGDYLSGKCLDNRSQVYVLIRTLQRLKKPTHDTYAVFTVQEEVGLRGALPSSYGIDPDIGIALDTTLACDTPGISSEQHITKLGAGVGIKVMDGSLICSRELVDQFVALAKKTRTKYQLELLPAGGTDGGAIQRVRSGVRTIVLSIPTRYIHTITESIHRDDLKATENLLWRYLEA